MYDTMYDMNLILNYVYSHIIHVLPILLKKLCSILLHKAVLNDGVRRLPI